MPAPRRFLRAATPHPTREQQFDDRTRVDLGARVERPVGVHGCGAIHLGQGQQVVTDSATRIGACLDGKRLSTVPKLRSQERLLRGDGILRFSHTRV